MISKNQKILLKIDITTTKIFLITDCDRSKYWRVSGVTITTRKLLNIHPLLEHEYLTSIALLLSLRETRIGLKIMARARLSLVFRP